MLNITNNILSNTQKNRLVNINKKKGGIKLWENAMQEKKQKDGLSAAKECSWAKQKNKKN